MADNNVTGTWTKADVNSPLVFTYPKNAQSGESKSVTLAGFNQTAITGESGGIESIAGVTVTSVSGGAITFTLEETAIATTAAGLSTAVKVTPDANDNTNYSLALTNVGTVLAISEASTSISGNSLNVTGKASSYYNQDSTDTSSLVYYAGNDNANLASVSNLKNALNSGDVVLGTTAADSLYIKVKEGALDDNKTVSLTSTYGYKLQLVDSNNAVDDDGKFGFAVNNSFISLSSGEGVKNATIGSYTAKGWALGTDSMSIVYTPATLSPLATITGLASTVTQGADTAGSLAGVSIEGAQVNNRTDYTITLDKSVLQSLSSNVLTLTDVIAGDTNYYVLKLNDTDGGGDNGETDGKLGLVREANAWSIISGAGDTKTAIYNYKTTAGWEVSGDSLKVTYATDKYTTLTQIAGLNTGIGGASASVAAITGVTVSDNTFVLGANAFTSSGVSLTGDGNLSIAAGAEGGGSIGGDTINYGTNGTATISQDFAAAYALKSGSKTIITYTAPHTDTHAIIGGLSQGDGKLTASNLTIDSVNHVVNLFNSVLNNADVKFTDNAGLYKFSLATSGENSINTAPSIISGTPEWNNDAKAVTSSLQAYYTLENESMNVKYHAEIPATLASIAGLKSDLETGVVSLDSANNKVINIKKGALLTQGASLTQAYDYGYKLQLDDDGATNDATTDDGKIGFGDSGDVWSLGTDGTAYFMHYTTQGWSLGADSLTIDYVPATDYKVIAEVTGLSVEGGLSLSSDSKVLGFMDDSGDFAWGISAAFAATSGSDSIYTFTVAQSLLSARDITITDKVANDNKFFKLQISNNNGGASSSLGFGNKDGAELYWAGDGANNVSLQFNTAEGWSVGSGDSIIAYSPESVTAIAKIENLSSGISISSATASILGANTGANTGTNNAFLQGVSIGSASIQAGGLSYTFTLGRNVLGTDTSKAATLVDLLPDDNRKFKFALQTADSLDANYVPTDSVTAFDWKLGTNTTLNLVAQDYYKLGGTEAAPSLISYHAQETIKPLATITGLKASGVNEGVFTFGGTSAENTDYINSLTSAALVGTISIASGALGSNLVSISGGYYNLGLSANVAAPSLSGQDWTYGTTTAKYTAAVSEGYELAGDSMSIIYSPKKSAGSTIFTINGLNNTTKDSLKIALDEASKTVSLKSGVLAKNDITISTTVGSDYKLALADDDNIATADRIVASLPALVTGGTSGIAFGWDVATGRSANTAVFKAVNPAYYEEDAETGGIKYTAESVLGSYATITGLATTAVIPTDSVQAYTNIGAIEGISINAVSIAAGEKDGIITITDKSALTSLTGTDVVLANASGYSLKFAFDDPANFNPKPTEGAKPKWSFSQGKATLMSSIDAGWRINGTSTAISYYKSTTNGNLATITGLNSSSSNFDAASISGASSIISLNSAVLTNSDVSITSGDYGTNYELFIETNDDDSIFTDQSPSITSGTNVWSIDSANNVLYENVKLAHYSYVTVSGTAADGTDTTETIKSGIKYNPEEITDTLLSISGLKTGLTTDSLRQEIGTGTGTNFTQGISLGSGAVTLGAAVLGNDSTKAVSVSAGDYQLKLAGDVSIAGVNQKLTLKYTTGTVGSAVLHRGDIEGYKLENNIITYIPDNDGASVAALAGLKGGLSVSGASVEGIEYSAASVTSNKTITLSKAALGNSGVTLTSNDYALKLKSDENFDATQGTAWSISGDNAYLVDYTSRSYAAVGKEIKYYKAIFGDVGNAFATITGLKSGLTVDDDGQIAGISIGADGAISLSKDVLGTKDNITITDKDGDNTVYKLALYGDSTDSLTYVAAPEDLAPYWSVNSKAGTIVYTEKSKAGYSLGGGGADSIIYYSPDYTDTTTIKGLKMTGMSVFSGTDSVSSVGISGKGITLNSDTGLISLSSDVLLDKNTKNTVTLTYTGREENARKLALASDVAMSIESPKFEKADNANKATYTQTTKAGYWLSEDGKTITTSTKDSVETLFTLTGLKKEKMADSLNAASNSLIEVTAPTTKEVDVSLNGEETGEKETINVPGVIILKDSSILDATNVALGNKDNYEISIASGVRGFAVESIAPDLEYKNGTATFTYGTTGGWVLAKDADNDYADIPGKTLTYKKPTSTNILTISGLNKELKYGTGASDSLKIQGISLKSAYGADTIAAAGKAQELNGVAVTSSLAPDATFDKGVILLDARALNGVTKSITFKNDNYKFEFASSIAAPEANDSLSVNVPTAQSTVWSASKGTLKYQYDTNDGYTISEDGKTVTYNKAKTDVILTLTGLNKDLVTGDGTASLTTSSEIAGITFEEPVYDDETGALLDYGTVTFTEVDVAPSLKALGTSDIALAKNVKDYKLVLDSNLAPDQFDKPVWLYSGTAATYRTGTKEGYTLSDDERTIKYHKEAEKGYENYVKITGLAKGIAESVFAGNDNTVGTSDDAIVVDIIDKTVQINDSSVLATSNIKLTAGKKGETYTFIDVEEFAPKTVTDSLNSATNPKLEVKSGTATLKETTGDGFVLTDDSTLTYKKGTTTTLATVKGLNKDLIAEGDTKDGNKTTAYGDELGESLSSGFASYVQFDHTNKTITIKNEALQGKKVTIDHLKGTAEEDMYSFELDGEVHQDGRNVTDWVTSGTAASYRSYNQDYYKLSADARTIDYEKATGIQDHVKISGIAKGADLHDAFNDESKTVTLTEAQLAEKNVTIKVTEKNKTNAANYADFKLALDIADSLTTKMSITGSKNSGATNGGWETKSGTSILYGTMTTGYTLADDGKSITYLKKAKENQKLVTIKGLDKNATVTGSTNSITDTGTGKSIHSGVVNLTTSQLTNKDLTITGSDYADYTISLTDSANSIPSVSLVQDSEDSKVKQQTLNKGKLTITGSVEKEGYIVSASNKSITYFKGSAADTKNGGFKTQALVTVNGVDKNLTDASAVVTAVDASARTVTLNGAALTNKVTANGGVFAVEIDSGFTNSTLIGSAKADSLKVQGSGITVNAGKGDDYVDLAGTGNTFVYAKNDGNDVIANFDSTDKIDMSKVALAESDIKKKDSDVVIKVGTGSITLKNVASLTSINIIDKNNKSGKEYTVSSLDELTTSGNPLLADENFATTDPVLSDLVNSGNSNNSISDWSATKDITSLTPTNNVVAYGGDKK